MLVKVAKLGTRVIEVALEENATVAAAMDAAAMDHAGYQIRRAGVQVEMSAPLADGNVLTMVPQVKGGGK